jgi:hypothetical protein
MSRLAGLQRTTVQFVYTCEVYTFMMVIFSFSLCDAAQFCLLFFYSVSPKYLSLSNLVEARIMFIFWHWFWHINLMHRGRKIIVKMFNSPLQLQFSNSMLQCAAHNISPMLIFPTFGLAIYFATSRKRTFRKFDDIFDIPGKRSITLFASFPFCFCTLYPVLWIGIVLMPIRILIYMFMTGSGLASKWCRSLCGSYPKFHTSWKMWFKYFGQHITKKYRASTFSYASHWYRSSSAGSERLAVDADPDLARCCGSDPIHIGIHNTVLYRFVGGNNGQWSDALARFSVNRFQKLFAFVTWYV